MAIDVLTALAKRRARSLQAGAPGVNVLQAASPAAPAAPAAPAVPSAGTNATRIPGSDSGLQALSAVTATGPGDPGVRAGQKVSAPLKYEPRYDVGAPQGGEDPRDAAYWANVAKLKWTSEQEAARLQREDTAGDIATERALVDLASNRNYQDRATRQALAAGNLGSSTTAFGRFAQEEGAYGLAASRAIEDHGMQEAARQAAVDALNSGFTIEEAIQRAEAAARLADRKAREAQNAPPDTAAPAAAAPYAPPAPGVAGKVGAAAGPPPYGKDSYWTGTRWVKIGAAVPASHGNLASGPPPGPNYAWNGQRWIKVR